MVALSLVLIGQKIARGIEARAIDWRAAGRGLGTWAAFTAAAALLKPLGFALSFALLTFFVVAVIFSSPLLHSRLIPPRLAAPPPPLLPGRTPRSPPTLSPRLLY